MGKLILAGVMVAWGVTWMGPASGEAQAVANKPDSGANQKLPLMHVKKRAEWLQTIHSQMRSESRLVLIDFKEGDLPEGPPEKIKVPKAEVIRLCKEAGFTLKADRSDLLPYQEFLVFERR